jgi:hypothetical protein
MRRMLSIIALLIPSILFAAPAINPDAACQSSLDCVAIEHGGCSGGWSIINKKHAAEYIKKARDMNSVIECAKVSDFQPKPTVQCVNKTCIPVKKI